MLMLVGVIGYFLCEMFDISVSEVGPFRAVINVSSSCFLYVLSWLASAHLLVTFFKISIAIKSTHHK